MFLLSLMVLSAFFLVLLNIRTLALSGASPSRPCCRPSCYPLANKVQTPLWTNAAKN